MGGGMSRGFSRNRNRVAPQPIPQAVQQQPQGAQQQPQGAQQQPQGAQQQSAGSNIRSTGFASAVAESSVHHAGVEQSRLNMPENFVAQGSPSYALSRSQPSGPVNLQRSSSDASLESLTDSQNAGILEAYHRLYGTPVSSTVASSGRSSVSEGSVNSILPSSPPSPNTSGKGPSTDN